jgi:hypothetical protein
MRTVGRRVGSFPAVRRRYYFTRSTIDEWRRLRGLVADE